MKIQHKTYGYICKHKLRTTFPPHKKMCHTTTKKSRNIVCKKKQSSFSRIMIPEWYAIFLLGALMRTNWNSGGCWRLNWNSVIWNRSCNNRGSDNDSSSTQSSELVTLVEVSIRLRIWSWWRRTRAPFCNLIRYDTGPVCLTIDPFSHLLPDPKLRTKTSWLSENKHDLTELSWAFFCDNFCSLPV